MSPRHGPPIKDGGAGDFCFHPNHAGWWRDRRLVYRCIECDRWCPNQHPSWTDELDARIRSEDPNPNRQEELDI